MLSLLELLRGSVVDALARVAAKMTGETEVATRNALELLLPVALGAMLQRNGSLEESRALFHVVTAPGVDRELVAQLAQPAAGLDARLDRPSLDGTGIAHLLFGEHIGDLAATIARGAGLKPVGALRLITISLPVVLAWMKGVIHDEQLDVQGFAQRLDAERKTLLPVVDRRLIGALGLSGPDVFLGAASAQMEIPDSIFSRMSERPPEEPRSGLQRALPWLVLVLGVFLLVPLLRSCGANVQESRIPQQSLLNAGALSGQ